MATVDQHSEVSKSSTRSSGFLLGIRIDGAHPRLKEYYLLPEDLLVLEDDGTYTKVGPGMAVSGFELTSEQSAELEAVKYRFHGLDYEVFRAGE